MDKKTEKFKEVKKVLEGKPEKFVKRVNIIFDGKQYNIRIPIEFVKKSRLDPNKDEFEFILEMLEDKEELPSLYGELVEKK